MESGSNLLMNVSILYRCMQKYYDKQLEEYQLSAGLLVFVILIYENEGISMYHLAQKGSFDKGTVSKSISKLENLGYISVELNSDDKRLKILKTTEKTKNIIGKLYLLRRKWWERITKDFTQEELDEYDRLQVKLTQSAAQYASEDEQKVRLFGFQKLTLLDYPGKLGCTVFTGGCNFRCPFCQNGDLVFLPENQSEIEPDDIMTFLKKRKGILEGVCISGGEPLLQGELKEFIRQIKTCGYHVKLDTNGSYPDKLKELVEEKLIDYVAMDIKNSPTRYGETIGLPNVNLDAIKESVNYLLSGVIPYEFRTTIVEEFHSEKDMKEIGKWLKGADAYYLQNFVDGECVIQKGLHPCKKETLQRFREILLPSIPNTEIRGI